MNLKFHWRLVQGGERDHVTRAGAVDRVETGLPEIERQAEFCRRASECGISGVLVDIGASKPDPILLAAALGCRTAEIEFIVACRSGLYLPTTFVQQINTLSALLGGRVSINVVAGHSPEEQRFYGDFLPHSERYARTNEFLAVCRAFWACNEPVNFCGEYYRIENGRLNTPFQSEKRSFPELFIGGGSEAARELAIRQGTLWMRIGDTPCKIAESIRPVLAAGKEAGLRMSVIARPSRGEALSAAYDLINKLDPRLRDPQKERAFMLRSDSFSIRETYELADTEWLAPWLWTGAIRTHGAPAIAIVGDYVEVAEALVSYGKAGVTQFILSGWPKLSEMERFGREVIPRVYRLLQSERDFAASRKETGNAVGAH